MRWFVYLLGAFNAVFLYMNVEAARRSASLPPAPPPATDTVRQLLLIAEIDPAELHRRGAGDAEAAVASETAVPDDAAVAAADARATTGESGNASSNREQADGETQASTVAGEQRTGDGAGTTARDAATTDTTTTETATARAAESAASAGDEVAAAEASSATPAACFSIGPFSGPQVEAGVAAWLDGADVEHERREGQRREVSRYWVHLAPAPDLAAARAVSADLARRGVDDLHVIARGNMANTLSLGVYSRRASMERRVEQIRSMGHEPVVTERTKSVKAAWLEGRLARTADFPRETFAKRFADVPLKVGSCSSAGKLLRASALPRITRPESG